MLAENPVLHPDNNDVEPNGERGKARLWVFSTLIILV